MKYRPPQLTNEEQSQYFKKIVNKVIDKILAMPKEKLKKELKKHANGDVALFLKDMGGFKKWRKKAKKEIG